MNRYLQSIFYIFLTGLISCGAFNPTPTPDPDPDPIPDPVPDPEPYFFMVPLSGANEIPAGDNDGNGVANIMISVEKTEICWDIIFAGLDEPNAAHIHSGGAGVNGDIVFNFDPFPKGCSAIMSGLVDTILEDLENYYINVHSADFPEGAIRGQIKDAAVDVPRGT